MKVQHQMLPSGSRRNKPLKKSNKRGSKGDEDEEEDNEMVTMSDYEPLVKSPKRPFMTFTDEELGIKRAAWSSDDEEVLVVRRKAAEVLKSEFGVGDGLLPREQEDDSDDEEGEEAAAALAAAFEPNRNTRRNSKRFKPNPLDLINSTGNAGPSSSTSSAIASSDAANGGASHEQDDQKFKRLFLVEKAKFKFLQAENAEIQKEMAQLKAEEARVRDSKREALERILTLELGRVCASPLFFGFVVLILTTVFRAQARRRRHLLTTGHASSDALLHRAQSAAARGRVNRGSDILPLDRGLLFRMMWDDLPMIA